MKQQVIYEVVREEAGWFWQLRDADRIIAVDTTWHESARGAREAIDNVRGAITTLRDSDADSDGFFYPLDTRLDSADFRIRGSEEIDAYEWEFIYDGDLLAVSSHTYRTPTAAREAARTFEETALGGVPVYLIGGASDMEHDPFTIERTGLRGALGALRRILTRGRSHRQYLADIDTRIVVSGIRGKSSTTRRLDDVFNRRGYDVLTKITGNRPLLLRNGDAIPINRTGPYTTLYENINVLREFGSQLTRYTPDDVAIFENQGITEYTTRLINTQFVRPHIVVLANVRQDHQDTLGKTLRGLARAFARSIPSGTKVVNGEQNDVLAAYMREEITQQGAEMKRVEIPPDQQGRVGAETVYACNEVLRLLDMEPISDAQLNAYLDAIQPHWAHLPQGRVFNGSEINDIESTEAIRRALAGDTEILPFVYLRADRRSRTASFATYLNTLADRGLIDKARAGGAFTDVFAANVDVPVTQHRRDEDAGVVLDEMLAEGLPVLLMGNTVDDFMRDMETEITQRAQRSAIEGGTEEWRRPST